MLLLHMKHPVDGLMDERAPYVALSRATSLENLFMVAKITLAQLRHKPKAHIAATLDFLDRLDAATTAAFLKFPWEFSPVTVRSARQTGQNGTGGKGGGSGSGGDSGGGGGSGSSGPETTLATFLAPNSRNNCFHNAAIASALAAFDGQPLPSAQSLTPSAKVFFSSIQAVRDHMNAGALPNNVLVSTLVLKSHEHPLLTAFSLVLLRATHQCTNFLAHTLPSHSILLVLPISASIGGISRLCPH